MSKWDWMDDALCKDADVDFFSEDPKEIQRAKEVCFECPVRRKCLQYALDTETRFGVWGGADEVTLRKALNIDQYGKPIARVRPMKCPLCSSQEVVTVEVKRTTQHLRCAECALSWWARVPSTVVRINAEEMEEDDEEDAVAGDIPAGS